MELSKDAGRRMPDALILASPPLSTPGKIPASRLALIVWRFLTGSKKPIDFTGRAGLLSADPAEVEDIAQDPLRTRALPASFLVGVRRLQGESLGHARRVVVPTLILWGENDDVASFPHARELLAAIRPDLRTIEVRPGERHMLTRGAIRAETALIIARWIGKTVTERGGVDRASRGAR